ncbi:MAG: hypothetical protein AUJ75_03880 [Candidatus Omnitrophica bacterium CG1_02_49_10]|nr:MAG: hypothetical protein AUJ75_03880 [Candidatus Omnitrophica bacterium CG1_02_49_10]
MDKKEALRRCLLFSNLKPQDTAYLTSISITKKYKKDELIFRQGAEAFGLFVIMSGKAKIFKISSAGKEYIMKVVSAGDSMAEAAVFSDSGYPAYAGAITDCQAIFIPKREFVSALKMRPDMSVRMLAVLSDRLRELNALIEDLSLKDVAARVVKYIVDVAVRRYGAVKDGLEVDLEIPKNQLALKLGTAGETLSRTLKRLKDQKMISLKRKTIIIRDAGRLQKIISGA